MNWIPVKSSNIEAIAYDPSKKILSVKFHKSGIYHYEDVPELMYREMLEAESAGKYFSEYIKGIFDYKKGEDR